jgi:LCP family protein required for cell wall assembly
MAQPPGTRTRLRRTWPQRLVLGLNVVVALACLIGAAGVWYANSRLGSLERVVITHDPEAIDAGGSQAIDGTFTPTSSPEPEGEVPASNFLLVGSDSRDCIAADVANAAAFLGEPVVGGRSDTIMVLRVERNAQSAAILSFPRDLWVRIADSNRRGRINSAFDPNDPSRLVQTIENNFGVHIDHYVDVDFCAFKKLVEVVGGVRVPFAYPTRDRYSGLNVTAPGCITFDGDAALAYVRSRHYEYQVDGQWEDDNSSDFGRIARQQDFIRRALQKALDRGARQPLVAKQLIDAALANVKVDDQLTLSDLYSLANRLRSFDTNTVKTYRIDGQGVIIGGAAVIQPDTTSARARAILDYFRGAAGGIAGDGGQGGASTSTSTGGGSTGGSEGSSSSSSRSTSTSSTTEAGTTTTAAAADSTGDDSATTTGPDGTGSTTTTLDPSGRPPDLVTGIVPPDDPTCR